MEAVRTVPGNLVRATALAAAIGGLSLLAACDNTKSTTKTTEKTVKETPQGTTTTTETHERKVDVDKK